MMVTLSVSTYSKEYSVIHGDDDNIFLVLLYVVIWPPDITYLSRFQSFTTQCLQNPFFPHCFYSQINHKPYSLV